MSFVELYKRVENSVVQVITGENKSPTGFSTGSVVGDGTKVLTCAHCVQGAKQIAIVEKIYPNGQIDVINAKILAIEPKADLAILGCYRKVGDPVIFSDIKDCPVGSSSFTIGYPANILEKTFLSAFISTVSESLLRIDCSINQGNSGGPLFNMRGEQIGVVNAKHCPLPRELEAMVKSMPANQGMYIANVDLGLLIQTLTQTLINNISLGIGYAITYNELKKHQSIFDHL
ncbi:serine protease [Klebsiella pneumoniae]|uniref:S1 family peptidase n=1 Tax=Klebsiella pneumoniae complex TaxID=3390273 RepID=UPI0024DE0E78|nr:MULTISPECIES: serine protease [Klebsiella]MDK1773766.1 serine protease [Klebsiella pneumoniae]